MAVALLVPSPPSKRIGLPGSEVGRRLVGFAAAGLASLVIGAAAGPAAGGGGAGAISAVGSGLSGAAPQAVRRVRARRKGSRRGSAIGQCSAPTARLSIAPAEP